MSAANVAHNRGWSSRVGSNDYTHEDPLTYEIVSWPRLGPPGVVFMHVLSTNGEQRFSLVRCVGSYIPLRAVLLKVHAGRWTSMPKP